MNLVAAEQRGQDDYRSDGGSIEGWVAGCRAAYERRSAPIDGRAGEFAVVQPSRRQHRVAQVYRVWSQGVGGRVQQAQAGKERMGGRQRLVGQLRGARCEGGRLRVYGVGGWDGMARAERVGVGLGGGW